ncbi:MAG TPA: penicillin-binding protein 1A [Alphaproteobacteria bacterium]|nr:penicillin-binding protein 1A [Alphaproteobacteria bacterium]
MRFISWAFSIGVLLLIAGIGSGFWVLHQYSQNLPDFQVLKNYEPPILSRVYAGDGRLLATFAAEQRVFVPIQDIPQRVKDAFLSAEDKDFYIHPGVDVMGIGRAVLANLQNLGSDRHPYGASTITQQVAKNMLLTNEVSITRKIREAILAFRIESVLSKDRILEIYLNQIFLGNHSYGVAAASLNYFNKPLSELSISEAAFLGALPKAPNNYNPAHNLSAALARRNWVIGRMLEDGKITAAEAKAAKADPLQTRTRGAEESVRADYYAEEVRRELVEAYGNASLLNDGYTVRTSLDPKLQMYGEDALHRALISYDQAHTGWRGPAGRLTSLNNWAKQLAKMPVPPGGEEFRMAAVLDVNEKEATLGFSDGTHAALPFANMKWARKETSAGRYGAYPKRPQDVVGMGDVILVDKDDSGKKDAARYKLMQVPKVQGAFVALDPHTGRVLALVGGFSDRLSAFNRATQAYRQVGSAFKPFVYLAALDNGFTPSSLINDAPVELSQGPGLPMWQPSNFDGDYLGPMTMRRALEKSRNVVTVRLAQAVGMDKIVEYAKKFGIADDMPNYLSFSLGAKETTPLRLTAAYAMLANGGKKISPSFIDRIQDNSGQTIWKHDRRPCEKCHDVDYTQAAAVPEIPDQREQINDPRSVYQITLLLQGVATRGTAASVGSLGRTLAGKTGTTNDSKDLWFVGFSPNLVAGVFIGYDDPQPLGERETGGSVAVPVFKEFMEHALAGTPDQPFRVPPGVQLMRVDHDTGLPPESPDAKVILEAFLPGTDPESSQKTVLGGGDAMPPQGENAGTGENGLPPGITHDPYPYPGYNTRPPSDYPQPSYGPPPSGVYGSPPPGYPPPQPYPPPGSQPPEESTEGLY